MAIKTSYITYTLLFIFLTLLIMPTIGISDTSVNNYLPIHKVKIKGLDTLDELRAMYITSKYEHDSRYTIVDTSGFWSWQDYPYPIPDVEPVEVPIAVNEEFAAWKPKEFNVTIPEGEWSRILLRVDGSLYDPVYGRPVQYDRVLWIYVNDVPVFWGSTPQRYNWTVTSDVTMFYSLFKGQVRVEVWLPNVIAPQIGVTGRFLVNITLLLYPGDKPDNLPDMIIPLWKREILNRKTPAKNFTVAIPDNVTRAMLLMYTKGNGYDEFWYYFGDLYREVRIYFDDKLVALVHPMHTIFTGGMSPFLWRPLPAVRTYAEEPTLIDLTGALPLVTGTHNVTLEIKGIYGGYWQIGAALLLWTTNKPVKYELVNYESKPYLSVEHSEENGIMVIRATSSYYFNATSKLYIGDNVIEATSYYYTVFTAERRYDNYYDNLTIHEYKISSLNYNVLTGEEYKSFTWSYEWNAPLDIKYYGTIEIYGDLSKASVNNPVPGAIVEYIAVSQRLRTTTHLRDSKGIHTRVLDESVYGRVKWNIELLFISPTGAVVTGVSYANAQTSKVCHGMLSEFTNDDWKIWNYTRSSVSRTYITSNKMILYN
ncbi:MAG: peptide-N4-asparagine amidase, partial [Thermoprotei archaeon]